MANRKSSAAQAIKDMQELGMNVALIMGHISEIHVLNAEISIVTRNIVKKQPKPKPERVYKPKPVINKYRHVYNQRIIINVDGTVSIECTEWDYK